MLDFPLNLIHNSLNETFGGYLHPKGVSRVPKDFSYMCTLNRPDKGIKGHLDKLMRVDLETYKSLSDASP